MPQSIILAVGTSDTPSTDIVIAAGASVNFGIYVATGNIPVDAMAKVYMDSPGADVPLAVLDQGRPVTNCIGPGTFRIERVATALVGVGVFLET